MLKASRAVGRESRRAAPVVPSGDRELSPFRSPARRPSAPPPLRVAGPSDVDRGVPATVGAVVRKPVWATIRWSGRTDRASTCQVRWSTSTVSARPKPAASERAAELRGLVDGRQVHEEDAAGAQRGRGVRQDAPRLGHIEQDPVEIALVDAFGDVADLDAVVRVGADERGDVGPGPGSEVVTQLVADDGRAGPQHGHRQCAGPDAGFEDALAGGDVGGDQDGAEVLRIDDLRPTRHLEDDVGQRRAQDEERAAGRPDDGRPLVEADDVVVGDDPGVRVEHRSRDESDEVVAVLGVDQEDPLARGDGRWHVGQVPEGSPRRLAGADRLTTNRSPGLIGTERIGASRARRARRRANAESAMTNHAQCSPSMPCRNPDRARRRRSLSTG